MSGDVALETLGEHVLDLPDEHRDKPRLALHPQSMEQRHRQLGEIVAGEHIDRPAAHHLGGRAEPIPVECAGIGDDEPFHHAAWCPNQVGGGVLLQKRPSLLIVFSNEGPRGRRGNRLARSSKGTLAALARHHTRTGKLQITAR
jgi:hypothetical protein